MQSLRGLAAVVRPGQLSGESPSSAIVDPRSDEIPIELFVVLDPPVDLGPDSAVPPRDLTALRPPQGRQEVTRSLVYSRGRYFQSRDRAPEAGAMVVDEVAVYREPQRVKIALVATQQGVPLNPALLEGVEQRSSVVPDGAPIGAPPLRH